MGDPALNGSITAGDFNSRPTGTSLERVLFPDVATFRHDPSVKHWISCIDSFVAPTCLANTARVSGLEAVPCAQHRPVLLELAQNFKSHDIIELHRPSTMDLGSWAPGALDATIRTRLGGAGQMLLASLLPPQSHGV